MIIIICFCYTSLKIITDVLIFWTLEKVLYIMDCSDMYRWLAALCVMSQPHTLYQWAYLPYTSVYTQLIPTLYPAINQPVPALYPIRTYGSLSWRQSCLQDPLFAPEHLMFISTIAAPALIVLALHSFEQPPCSATYNINVWAVMPSPDANSWLLWLSWDTPLTRDANTLGSGLKSLEVRRRRRMTRRIVNKDKATQITCLPKSHHHCPSGNPLNSILYHLQNSPQNV